MTCPVGYDPQTSHKMLSGDSPLYRKKMSCDGRQINADIYLLNVETKAKTKPNISYGSPLH